MTKGYQLPASILSTEKFLLVDNAFEMSEDIETQLSQIFTINDLDFSDFKHEYAKATDESTFSKISAAKNILVSTTFTTIKSNAIEDLLEAGIKHGLKDKNIFSLMQFSIVGGDFEYYDEEIAKLGENNVHFYFISDNFETFDRYTTSTTPCKGELQKDKRKIL